MTITDRPAPVRDLADLVARRVPGRPLEREFYTDGEIFDLDLTAIWATHWIFVAVTAQVPEPGDFLTVELGSYSVIVLRDDDEQVRAVHNVCRHRGARILQDASGSVGNIVCGYHQWTYATDGSLLHAGPQPAGFDKSCLGLRPVHVRVVGGLVFLCLADEPPADFDDVAARITPYLAPHQLERTKVAHQEDLVENANWKLVMENNRECYHCDGGHPELTATFFPTYGYDPADIPRRLAPAFARFQQAEAELQGRCDARGLAYEPIEELTDRPTGFRIQREALDAAGESYTLDGRAASQRLLGDLDTPSLGRLTLHLQPNSWFHFLGDHAVTFSVLPLGVDRTLVRTTWLVHEDAVEGVDYDLDRLTEVWHQTNAQDGEFTSRAQLGVSSPAYEPGPYSASEYQVDAFCSWYVERLREHLVR